MNHFVDSWNWFLGQNLAVQGLIVVGILNVIIAGLKQAGYPQLADICQKIEDTILAMINAAKFQLFGAKKPEDKSDTPPDDKK